MTMQLTSPTPETPPILLEHEPAQRLSRMQRAGRLAAGVLLGAAPLAGGIAAIEFDGTTHVDIAGQDVSVRPVIGQNYTQLDGAIMRPEHAHVAGFDIGLKIDADWNQLMPADQEDRAELAQVWDDPAPEINRIETAARNDLLTKGAGGAGATILLEMGAVGYLRHRRRQYETLSEDKKAIVDQYNYGTRRIAAAAGIVALGSLYVSAGYTLAHRDHHTIVANASLNGTPLEGTEVNGLLGDALPFVSLIEPKSSFYDTVSNNLNTALTARPDLAKDDDSTVFVVAEDFEDVNGMARQVGLTAKTLGADFIGYTGDLTFGGKPAETPIIDTMNYYSDNTPVLMAAGLHDTEYILQTATDRGWQVADDQSRKLGDLKILAENDPRISTIGNFNGADVLRDPKLTIDQFVDNAVAEICKEQPDILLEHDNLLAKTILQKAAEQNCAVGAAIDGRSFKQLGAQYYPLPDGGQSAEFTAASGGGHTTTTPNPGNIQSPATFEIFKHDTQTGDLTYAVVTVKPDASVTISAQKQLAQFGGSESTDASLLPKHKQTVAKQ